MLCALTTNGRLLMRRLLFVAAALAALAAASVAVAEGIEGAKTAKSVTGTFSATQASVTTRTCTTSDGKSLSITLAKYTGSSTGDPDLTGPLTIRARSVINTTDNVGVVEGALRIDVASGRDTHAGFAAVYDHGNIAVLAVGRAHDPSARLVANLSAAFSQNGGFTGGKLGGGTGAGSAVELGPGRCGANAAPEKSEARGTISALSSTSITVAGLTCAIPADKSADVNSHFKVNDRAEIHCALLSGTNTLTKIERR
jgi:hypothetical protein